MLDELCNAEPYVAIIITHFFNKPSQNSGFLRKLYLENDLSSYEISKKTGWPRSSVSDALRDLEIQKDERKAPVLAYGEKLQGTTRVVHKGEQKIVSIWWTNEDATRTTLLKTLQQKLLAKRY